MLTWARLGGQREGGGYADIQRLAIILASPPLSIMLLQEPSAHNVIMYTGIYLAHSRYNTLSV